MKERKKERRKEKNILKEACKTTVLTLKDASDVHVKIATEKDEFSSIAADRRVGIKEKDRRWISRKI